MGAVDSYKTMEIESGHITMEGEGMPQHNQIIMVSWSREWDLFKGTLKSAALCSSTDNTVKLA